MDVGVNTGVDTDTADPTARAGDMASVLSGTSGMDKPGAETERNDPLGVLLGEAAGAAVGAHNNVKSCIRASSSAVLK